MLLVTISIKSVYVYRVYRSIETVFTYCVIRNPLRLHWKSRLVWVAACFAAANDIAKDETVVDGAAKGLLRLMPRWYTSTPNNDNNVVRNVCTATVSKQHLVLK